VRLRPRCLHDGGGIGEEDRQPAKGNHRRRGASEAVGEPARQVRVPINQRQEVGPAAAPRKTGKRRVTRSSQETELPAHGRNLRCSRR
jgi:hypothetical protein